MKPLLFCLRYSCGLLLASAVSARSQPYAFGTAAGLAGQEAGIITPAGGDGTNNGARFYGPAGLALDNAGNLFVADGSAIRKITRVGTTNWVVTTLAGKGLGHGAANGTNSNAQFDSPQGVAVDGAGNVYVADTVNNAIRQLTASGTNWVVSTLAGVLGRSGGGYADGTNSGALFSHPYGIAVDLAGNLYVTDTSSNIVRKVTPVGTNWVVRTLAGSPGVAGSADGTNSIARFNAPSAVAADTNGNLYVTDFNNNTIRKLTPSGTNWVVTTLAGSALASGSADGTNSNALFNQPQGIALDSGGNLFVSDGGNNTIRKLKPSGTNWVVSTVAGVVAISGSADGVGRGASFNSPYGVAVDSSGRLYVADSYNYTVRNGQIAALMQLKLSVNQLVLSWPVALTGYVCETSSVLAPGSWSAHTNGLAISGDYVVQTNSIQPGNAFYRLHKP
jgi:streptogramin lyase